MKRKLTTLQARQRLAESKDPSLRLVAERQTFGSPEDMLHAERRELEAAIRTGNAARIRRAQRAVAQTEALVKNRALARRLRRAEKATVTL